MNSHIAIILKGMEQLLTSPEAWTTGAFARTYAGRMIGPHCRGASCFCLLGAEIKIRGATENDRGIATPAGYEARSALAAAVRSLFPDRCGAASDFPEHDVAGFNDHPQTTHADVLAVIRLAAAG